MCFESSMGQAQCCCQNDADAQMIDLDHTHAPVTGAYAATTMEDPKEAPVDPDEEPADTVVVCSSADKEEAQGPTEETPVELEPNHPNEYIAVFLRTEPGQVMGLHADQGNGRTLVVHEVKEDGIIGKWNQANPEEAVKKGDKFVSVNGRIDDAKALHEQLKTADRCECRILRQASTSKKPKKMASFEPAPSETNVTGALTTSDDPNKVQKELMKQRREMQKNWNKPKDQAPDHSASNRAKVNRSESFEKRKEDRKAAMKDKWDTAPVDEEADMGAMKSTMTGSKSMGARVKGGISEGIDAGLAIFVQRG